jgi:ribosomal protein L11
MLYKKKNKNKDLIELKLIVSSQLANVNSILGPLLGQYGIIANDFCIQFNERS